jgi:pyruvate/2-oxoglutarate dehydrogenase complex dihydrolipoamide dehydrogenase (E3) component
MRDMALGRYHSGDDQPLDDKRAGHNQTAPAQLVPIGGGVIAIGSASLFSSARCAIRAGYCTRAN